MKIFKATPARQMAWGRFMLDTKPFCFFKDGEPITKQQAFDDSYVEQEDITEYLPEENVELELVISGMSANIARSCKQGYNPDAGNDVFLDELITAELKKRATELVSNKKIDFDNPVPFDTIVDISVCSMRAVFDGWKEINSAIKEVLV